MAIGSGRLMETLHHLVSWKANALLRTLADVQGIVEDIRGAIAARQWDFAAISARHLIAEVGGICSMPVGGPLKWSPFEVGLCPGALAGAEVVDAGDELVEVLSDSPNADATERALELVVLLEAAAEQTVGLGQELPDLHAPDGYFAVMRLGRGLLATMDLLALPSVLPSSWLEDGGTES